jgi:succinate-acetate transporter protein
MDDLRANPAPLGLMGFGMTTVLLNILNAGFFEHDSTILAMGIFYGGIAQVIAGIMEYRKGNTFGVTAFTSYGLFWLSLVYILLHPPIDAGFLGWYLFLWGVFTAYMFIGTLPKNRGLQVVFGTLAILFFLLAIAHWLTGDAADTVEKIAGWEGIVCGFSAIYVACAEVLNDAHGKTVLPLGVVKKA